jgi:hypothetical protein
VTGIGFYFDDNAQVKGYWLVGHKGGVYTFGSAPFWGSSGPTDSRVSSLVSFPQPSLNNPHPRTKGYGWVDTDARLTILWAPETSQTSDRH